MSIQTLNLDNRSQVKEWIFNQAQTTSSDLYDRIEISCGTRNRAKRIYKDLIILLPKEQQDFVEQADTFVTVRC